MPVRLTREGKTALLLLDLRDTGYLLDPPTAATLERRCREAADDPEVLAVVLAGAGDHFCLGETAPGEDDAPSSEGLSGGPGPRAVRAVAALPTPVIAAVNGGAAAAGAELALACDLRLAAEDAFFQWPQLLEGTLPRAGGTQRLPRLVGPGRAMEVLLLGEPVQAQEAWRIGLASRVVSHPELLPAARALARRVADKAPIAVRYLKEAVHKGLDLTLDQGLHLEGDLYFLLQTTADRMEGIQAFLEKRKPAFRGE